MFLLLSSLAPAATLTVSEDLSIAQAVELAVSGDEIRIPEGEWELSEVDVGAKELTLVGESLPTLSVPADSRGILASGGRLNLVDLQFQGKGQFIAASHQELVLSGVQFEGGRAEQGAQISLAGGVLTAENAGFQQGQASDSGGAIHATDTDLTLSGVVFEDNLADNDGGAIYLEGGSLAVYGGSAFNVNEAGSDGGALYLSGVTANVGDSLFQGNALYDGYGAAVYFTGTALSGEGTEFIDNEATYGYGGGIYGSEAVSAVFSDCLFQDNHAYRNAGHIGMYYADGALELDGCVLEGASTTYGHGGAVFAYVRVDTVIRDTVIRNNSTRYHGGGIYQYYYGGLTLERVELTGNRSTTYAGGGLYSYYQWTGSTVSLTDVLIADNEATLEGGGAFVRYAGTLVLAGVRILNNGGPEGLYGGGLFSSQNDTVSLSQVEIAGNSATYGGGFYSRLASGKVDWRNVLVRENVARVGGGGCFVEQGILGVTNASLLGNEALDHGAALCLYDAHGEFTNLLVADNRGEGAIYGEDSDSGFYSSFRYSAFSGNDGGHLGGELLDEELSETGDLVDLDPALWGWSQDGDFDNDALALDPASPLVDAGDPAILDADGSVSDIGHNGGLAEDWDADGDGRVGRYDCDDLDPTVQDCEEDVPDTADSSTGEDTGSSTTPPAESGCGGCGGGLGGGAWLVGLLVLGWRRRR